MAKPPYTIEIFTWKHAGIVEYKWRIRHRNGNIIAIASEHYANKQEMIAIAGRMAVALKQGKYEIRDLTEGK